MRKIAVLLCIPVLLGACERHPIQDLHRLESGLVPDKKAHADKEAQGEESKLEGDTKTTH